MHGLRIGLDLTAFKPLQSMPHVVALLAANRQAGIPTPLLDEAFRGDGDGEASNGKGAKPGGDEGAKLVGNDGARLVGDEGAKLIGDEGAKLVGDDGEGHRSSFPRRHRSSFPLRRRLRLPQSRAPKERQRLRGRRGKRQSPKRFLDGAQDGVLDVQVLVHMLGSDRRQNEK